MAKTFTDYMGTPITEGARVKVTANGNGVPMHLAQGTHKVVGFGRTRVTIASGGYTGTYNVPAEYLRVVTDD